MTIYIDSRGKGEEELYELLKHKKLSVLHQKVDSGDIYFNGVCLERKTVNDLLHSVISGDRHFWEQLKVMKATYKRSAIIVEGFSTALYRDKQIMGILYSIGIGWGMPFYPSTSIYETAELIEHLYEKSDKKNDGPPPPAVKKSMTPKEIQWCMLQSVRGIGTVKAKEILQEVSFTKICRGEVKEIKCLNKKLSDRLLEVFKE